VGQFHGSAFRLARQAGASICPIAIAGNENSPARGSLVIHPATVTIAKLPAMTRQQYQDMNPYVMKTRAREAIQRYLDALPA
jgi:1-acyl-sn-glycerol-3-phosphate acyltransferase